MGNAWSATEERPKPSLDAAAATAKVLTNRHFVCQGERPDYLGKVDLTTLDPFLRGLLFTDGTVTRTLEVQAFSSVHVEVISQSECPALGKIPEQLEIPTDTNVILRRVAIGLRGSTAPVIWAESHIAPDRLPAGFLTVLDLSPDGIGESLQQVRLESYREMLWFGIDVSPDWNVATTDSERTVLRRLYRVISRDRPAMLISESFAIELKAGTYHLAL
jgi:chorismate-pyruvate lyase